MRRPYERLQDSIPNASSQLLEAVQTGEDLLAARRVVSRIEKDYAQATRSTDIEAPEDKAFAYRLHGGESITVLQPAEGVLCSWWKRYTVPEVYADKFFVGRLLEYASIPSPVDFERFDSKIHNMPVIIGANRGEVEPPRDYRLHLGMAAIENELLVVDAGAIASGEQFWPFATSSSGQPRTLPQLLQQ